jgi:hypothetical protein
VDYNFTGGVGDAAFTLSNITNIASTNGADGIIFSTNGNLLVGGQNSGLVHEVTTAGAIPNSRPTGTGQSFHLALNAPNAQNPHGSVVWSTGIPGTLSSLPLTGGALLTNGTPHTITNPLGQTVVITSLAFDSAGNAYFTSSGSGGNGSFGTINLTTFVATTTMTNVPAAHGMVFDPFSGDLILFGDGHISQIDLSNLTALESDLAIAGVNFDQGTADGQGHIFAADNNGQLFFLDYSSASLINHPSTYVDGDFLAEFLDDIAPLVGPGSQDIVPEATSVAIWSILGAVGLAFSFSRRRSALQSQ